MNRYRTILGLEGLVKVRYIKFPQAKIVCGVGAEKAQEQRPLGRYLSQDPETPYPLPSPNPPASRRSPGTMTSSEEEPEAFLQSVIADDPRAEKPRYHVITWCDNFDKQVQETEGIELALIQISKSQAIRLSSPGDSSCWRDFLKLLRMVQK